MAVSVDQGQSKSKASIAVFLVAGMLITGTANTLLNKFQDHQCIENCNTPAAKFYEQPVWQTFTMFIGEFICLIVFALNKINCFPTASRNGFQQSLKTNLDDDSEYQVTLLDEDATQDSVSRLSLNKAIEDDAADESSPLMDVESIHSSDKGKVSLTGWNIFVLWIPAVCDILGTTLMNVGLLAISASVYQMLRGAVVIFTAFLSYMTLGRKYDGKKILALIIVMIGVAIVGAAPIVFNETDASEGTSEIGSPAVGVSLVLLAQLFSALQFVVQEKIVTKYSASPLKLVGLEGFWGLFTIVVVMPIMHFSFGHDTGGFFDLVAGWKQLVTNQALLYSSIGCALSISAFNYFGLNITKYISATSRTTIDTCRTLFIWIISILIGWEMLIWLQVLGFALLIYGTFVFNQVFPFIPCMKSRKNQ